MRVHTYVIATDAGSAPNYNPPFVTLAVCKPRVRRRVAVGDLVLAFAGKHVNPHQPHTVVWAGIVIEKLPFAEYWRDPRFAVKKPDQNRRPDNFYRPVGGHLIWVPNSTHDCEATEHDISGLYVLAFDPAWRFGSHGPLIPEGFGLRMTGVRRGERLVELSDSAWGRLKTWLDDQPTVELDGVASGKACSAKRRRDTLRRGC